MSYRLQILHGSLYGLLLHKGLFKYYISQMGEERCQPNAYFGLWEGGGSQPKYYCLLGEGESGTSQYCVYLTNIVVFFLLLLLLLLLLLCDEFAHFFK